MIKTLYSLAAESFWGDLPTWLGVVGGLGAFCFGLWQYYRAQLWKRAEFVAAQMADFFSQSQVRTALLLLDYSRIKLKSDGSRANVEEPGLVFDDAICISSIRLHTDTPDDEDSFTSQEMIAREAFDALLTGLENLQHFIAAELLTPDDLHPYLAYWLDVMANPASAWKPPDFYRAIARFITGYGYQGVQELIREVIGLELKSIEPARPDKFV